MNKRGFTLIELLGVIIIIALLSLVVFPSLINTIKRANDDVNGLTEKLIFSSTQSYVEDNKDIFNKINGNIYCVTLEQLNKEGYIGSNITLDNKNSLNLKSVKIHYDGMFTYDIVDNDNCVEIEAYYQDILNGSDPVLNGLTPVIYENGSWKVADTTKKWYDYDNQEWANAVILKEGISKNEGTILNVPKENNDFNSSDILAMFVWIPRFEYKIDGPYGKDGIDAANPGEIEVNFINKDKTEANDGYIIHPGFTFGSDTLSGIWVGKFETSHETLYSSTIKNNLNCTNEKCDNASGLRILPNVQSIRYNNVANFFYASRSMENVPEFNIYSNKTDIHMMKNSEWGAVAYLSQSIYGKYGNTDYQDANKEIYLNNSKYRYTGKSAGEQSNSSDQKTSYGLYSYDDQHTGTGASTTGNIYGIYDMSGGSREFVMGWLNFGNFKDEGFDKMPDSKYYDQYSTPTFSNLCDGQCIGHALDETSGWYGDQMYYGNKDSDWFRRGGSDDEGVETGIFYFRNYNGEATSIDSFRIVFAQTLGN